jgi:class 3 adenylate cyclase
MALEDVAADKVDVIIIFVDIRGFTQWSEATEVFQYSPELVSSFFESIQHENNFSRENFFLKKLGDGALLIEEIRLTTPEAIPAKLGELLQKVASVNREFRESCELFSILRGHSATLPLGWGITRGAVNRVSSPSGEIDYLGANVNKAARLCDIARPFGIVVDAADFWQIPEQTLYRFHCQHRKLKSIGEDVSVWVTEEIFSEHLRREQLAEKPEVHVTGICFHKSSADEIKILIAKRNPDREFFPNCYEGCGGQLARSETFAQGVVRHFRKEMDVTVRVLEHIHEFYTIEKPEYTLVPGIKFLCEYVEGTPNSSNHSECRWVSVEEFNRMPSSEFVPGHQAALSSFLATLRRAGQPDS